MLQRSDGGGVFDALDRMNGQTLCGCNTVTACQVCSCYLCNINCFISTLWFSCFWKQRIKIVQIFYPIPLGVGGCTASIFFPTSSWLILEIFQSLGPGPPSKFIPAEIMKSCFYPLKCEIYSCALIGQPVGDLNKCLKHTHGLSLQ